MRAFVMAAGKGTRLAPFTDVVPKPVLPVGFEPAICTILRLLARHGFRDVAINASHLAPVMQAIIGDGSTCGVQVEWSVETELRGTAGGMKNLEQFLRVGDEPVLVLSGDGMHQVDLSAAVRAHRESGAFATLVLTPVDDASEYGVAVLDDSGRISGFQEKPAPGTELSNLCNTGIYIFDPAVFDRITPDTFCDFGSELIPAILDDGLHLQSFVHYGYWNDIGGIDAYRSAHLHEAYGLDRDDNDEPDDPNGILIHPTAKIGDDVTLIHGVVIGAHASVGSNSSLVDCVVLPGATVNPGTIFGGGIIGDVAGLGAWATEISGA